MNKTRLLICCLCTFLASFDSFAQEIEPEKEKPPVAKKADSNRAEKQTPAKPVDIDALVKAAAMRLVELQEEDGAWPYEGVYRVPPTGESRASRSDFVIPVGYRIGGSAIVCSALISAKLKNSPEVNKAITRSTELILRELESPLMEPSQANKYDVRVWGHIYALDYFCRLAQTKGFDDLKKKTNPWIEKLVDAVVSEEIEGGGWNYAGQRRHACFVTAPALQSLLLARKHGVQVPDEVFVRGAKILAETRLEKSGGFQYSGTAGRGDTLPGSIARGPICETTLILLGKGSQENLQFAINAFHEHWDELEKRRKKTGTHKQPHGIAPYYFYYGHRYMAQAIRLLPTEKQESEFDRFLTVLMGTKDPDNTWNDRVFDRSKAYGTAMSILALSRDSVLLPPALKK